MATKKTDLTEHARDGWNLNMALKPAYDSSPAGMAFLAGVSHRVSGRPFPQSCAMSRGYTVRMDGTLLYNADALSLQDLLGQLARKASV